MQRNKPDEQCLISYNEDHALITVSIRLEYGQERLEVAETLPSQPVSQEYHRLKAAMERYVSRIRGLDISDSGQWLKPRHYEVLVTDRPLSKQCAASPCESPVVMIRNSTIDSGVSST